eukprot:SAG22_NODE_1_length_62449_cov_158.689270_22_plen_101_part_00
MGRIEVNNPWTGTWGTVCGHWLWDNDNYANLLCQELGYTSGVLYTYGATADSAHVHDLTVVSGYRQCDGTEVAGTTDVDGVDTPIDVLYSCTAVRQRACF